MICGSPTEAATTTLSSKISTTTLTSTQLSHASSPIEPSTETTTTSVVYPIENTDASMSSSTINASNDPLSMESTTDNPQMLCKYTNDLIQGFLEIFYFYNLVYSL